jgi:hypothetical protein
MINKNFTKRLFKLESGKIVSQMKKLFSSGSHTSHEGSGSESDHDHDHSHDHHHKVNFYEDKKITEPWNTFRHVRADKFDVLGLIEKLRQPSVPEDPKTKLVIEKSDKSLADLDREYTEFLAESFRNVVSKKYPDYKKDLESYKHKIENFDKLNPYEKEVQILDAYMNYNMEQDRKKSFNIQENPNSNNQNDYESLLHRIELLGKLTKTDNGDTRVLKHLKKKLQKLLESDHKYSKFLKEYTEEFEGKVVKRVIENVKLGYSNVPTIVNKELKDIQSSLNPYYKPASATPHDSIKADDWLSNPDKVDNERNKYLALYDIIVDQHLRRVRPDNLEDDTEKYVAESHKGSAKDKDLLDNTLYDYTCKLDGEYYSKFRNELDKFFKNKDVNDPVSLFKSNFNYLFLA